MRKYSYCIHCTLEILEPQRFYKIAQRDRITKGKANIRDPIVCFRAQNFKPLARAPSKCLQEGEQ